MPPTRALPNQRTLPPTPLSPATSSLHVAGERVDCVGERVDCVCERVHCVGPGEEKEEDSPTVLC